MLKKLKWNKLRLRRKIRIKITRSPEIGIKRSIFIWTLKR
jgi:hypothetical protein